MSIISKLTEIANKIGTDKGTEHHEAHGYTEVYHSLFYLWKENSLHMMEIGVLDPRFPGASVKMWKEYFPYVKYVGFDINGEAKKLENIDDFVNIHIGDANNAEDLILCGNSYYKDFDIIIDDGSHRSEHIINSFHMLFPYVAPGGYYIIEDLHCQQAKRAETIRDISYLISENKFKVEYKDLMCNGKLLVIKKGTI